MPARYLPVLALALLATGLAAAEQAVEIGDARYDIEVELAYSHVEGPAGDVCPFESYRSVGLFEDVKFTESPSPGLLAWFDALIYVESADPSLPGAWERHPNRRLFGTGELTEFDLRPASNGDETVEAVVTDGPDEFRPMLQVVAPELAVDIATSRWDGVKGEAPPEPEEPTIWLLYGEYFSPDSPELTWNYPGIATGSVESRAFSFPVPVSRVNDYEYFEVTLPLQDSSATGEWTVRFDPRADEGE